MFELPEYLVFAVVSRTPVVLILLTIRTLLEENGGINRCVKNRAEEFIHRNEHIILYTNRCGKKTNSSACEGGVSHSKMILEDSRGRGACCLSMECFFNFFSGWSKL